MLPCLSSAFGLSSGNAAGLQQKLWPELSRCLLEFSGASLTSRAIRQLDGTLSVQQRSLMSLQCNTLLPFDPLGALLAETKGSVGSATSLDQT